LYVFKTGFIRTKFGGIMSQKILPMNIVIVEGPAGSGKSTIITSLIHKYPDIFTREVASLGLHNRPRDYGTRDGVNGGHLSAMKDYHSILALTETWLQYPKHILLVDRMFWSQIVYGTIRLGLHVPNNIRRALYCAFDVFMPIVTDYLSRRNSLAVGGPPKVFPEPKFLTIFNLPSAPIVEARRNLTTKDYPFMAQNELHIYRRVIEAASKEYYPMIKVGGGETEDEFTIVRGESETWQQMPDAVVCQNNFEVNRLRVMLGEIKILGAVLMGDQSLSQPLEDLVANEVDISDIRHDLLNNSESLGPTLLKYWDHWRQQHAN
jgi:GTPase SAR1 family protein